MDFDAIKENIPVILLGIGLLVLQLILRRGIKPRIAPLQIVQGLLSEIRLNQALAEAYNFQKKPKKFEMVSWQRNKGKLDFLGQSLQTALSDTFTMVEDFNQQIESAKKYKSVNYMVNVNLDKLKEPLARSRQGLEEWLQAKAGTKDASLKFPGILDDWLGKS